VDAFSNPFVILSAAKNPAGETKLFTGATFLVDSSLRSEPQRFLDVLLQTPAAESAHQINDEADQQDESKRAATVNGAAHVETAATE
jgi:hypothetical protein